MNKLAPYAEPADRVGATKTSYAPILALLVACLFTAALALGGLYWGVRRDLQRGLEALSSPVLSNTPRRVD